MEFLRRLLGAQSAQADETKPSAHPAPQITGPGSPVNTAAPAPVVHTPTKRTPEEIAEAALIDPTPIIPLGGTRQLPPIESMVTKPGKHAIYGLNSDIGMIRNNNQDSLLTFFGSNVSVEGQPDFGLFIVADGMGGHHDGERASAITTRTIGKHVIEKFYLDVLGSPQQQDADRPILSEVLSEAVQKANEAVAEEIPEGGTTVTAAAILSDRVFIAHVGDSRAYLITSEGIEQITRDHSLVQRLIELDKLTPEEALAHPQRNVLYRAIGQSEELEVDAVTRRLPAGARLLLCSDGLWNQVSEANLLRIVQAAKNPQDACDQLITLANDSGGPDNITVILIQVPG